MVLDPGHVDKQIFVTELIMILKNNCYVNANNCTIWSI